MADRNDSEERAGVISRLFALLTAKLEDAATVASDCQGTRSGRDYLKGAQSIIEFAAEVTTIALALELLIDPTMDVEAGHRTG